jgi:hypothetical protein
MSTRSPHNDRYKVEQKGNTRKSASSAKPKRVVADLTPASTSKKAPAKKSRWASRPAAQSAPAFAPTQKMKDLRRIWWILWVLSLAIAVGILFLQKLGAAYQGYVPFAWGLWIAAMGGAFYLELAPIRKARLEAMQAAQSDHKKPKDPAGGKAAKTPATKADTAVLGETNEDAPSDPEAK